jgi:excisionase family DNA binding protein
VEDDFVRQVRANALCTHVDAGRDASNPELLSPEQVARICGLSRRAVYRAIARGELVAARLCNRLRIRPDDLDRWIGDSIPCPADAKPQVLPHTATPPRGSLRHMLDEAGSNGGGRR